MKRFIQLLNERMFADKTAANKFLVQRQARLAFARHNAQMGLNKAKNMLSAAQKGAEAGKMLVGPLSLFSKVRDKIDKIAGVHDAQKEIDKHAKRVKAYDHLHGHYQHAKHWLGYLDKNDKTPIGVGRKGSLTYNDKPLHGGTLYWMDKQHVADQRKAEAKQHAEHLTRTMGTDEFEHHFGNVKKLLKGDIHTVASHFLGNTPKSLTKKKLLSKIYARHHALMTFDAKSKSRDGRSAA